MQSIDKIQNHFRGHLTGKVNSYSLFHYNAISDLFTTIKYVNNLVLKSQEFGISVIVTFSAILQLSRDKPVVIGGGIQSTWQKPPPNPRLLTTS